MEKSYSSTVAGQKAMFYEASSIATILMIDRKIAALGGIAWGESLPAFLATAGPRASQSIKDELIGEYNRILALKAEGNK